MTLLPLSLLPSKYPSFSPLHTSPLLLYPYLPSEPLFLYSYSSFRYLLVNGDMIVLRSATQNTRVINKEDKKEREASQQGEDSGDKKDENDDANKEEETSEGNSDQTDDSEGEAEESDEETEEEDEDKVEDDHEDHKEVTHSTLPFPRLSSFFFYLSSSFSVSASSKIQYRQRVTKKISLTYQEGAYKPPLNHLLFNQLLFHHPLANHLPLNLFPNGLLLTTSPSPPQQPQHNHRPPPNQHHHVHLPHQLP